MKTLQERMNDMKPYFRGIEMYNDALMVKVIYPDRWKAYPSADGRIKVTPSDTEANVTYYYADSNNTTYEDMFDLIEETIKANNDIILKLKLLKEKVEELKELFSQLTYEELQSLRFVTDKPKMEKPKRKYSKKKKASEKPQEEPQIENKEEDVKEEEIKNE
jgi:hypothetical protein